MGTNRKYREQDAYPTKQTGNIAKLMGLSDEGVRIYEKYGLVYPEIKDSTGYRSYDIMDITMLLYGRVYRECGFSLKEARNAANLCDLNDIAWLYEKNIVDLREKLTKEQWRLKRMEEILSDINLAKNGVNQCVIETRPGMYRIEFLKNRKMETTPEKQKLLQQWMQDYIPFIMISTRYPQTQLAVSREEIPSVGGLGIYETYGEFFGIRQDSHITYYPPAMAVHTVLVADNDILNPDFTECLKYIKHHGLKINGDVLSLGIASLHFSHNYDRYFHIWIPVEGDSQSAETSASHQKG